MMEGWKEYKLAEIGSFKNGVNFSSDKMGSGIALVNVKDITDSPLLHPERMGLVDIDISEKNGEAYLAKKGDMFFVRSSVKREGVGAVGMLKNNNEPVVHCGFVIRFRLKSKDILPRFSFYLFNTSFNREKVRNISGGATIVNISQGGLKMLKFKFPPLTTQRKIASILSAYDDLIENNLKRIKLLEEQAQQTYKEWFVRFKFPGYETAKCDEKSGLPFGWEKKRLGKVLEISSSKRIFLSDYVSEGIPFYRGKEIILKSKNEALNDRLYISENKFEEVKAKYDVPKAGDILVTAVGTLGYPYLVTKSDGDFYFKDGNLIWLKGNQNISSEYLISSFKNEHFQTMLNNIAIGSSQKALTIKSLKAIKHIIPSKSIQGKYNDLVIPTYDAIENFQNQNQLLKEARDILLPRLMSGMIDVDSLEVTEGLGMVAEESEKYNVE